MVERQRQDRHRALRKQILLAAEDGQERFAGARGEGDERRSLDYSRHGGGQAAARVARSQKRRVEGGDAVR